MNADNSTML